MRKTLAGFLVGLVAWVGLTAQAPHIGTTHHLTSTATTALVVGCALGVTSACTGGIIAGQATFTAGLAIDGGTISTHGIVMPTGVPSTTTMALYNNSGTLTWNGAALAVGSSVSGTQNFLPFFSSATSVGNSIIQQNAGATLATITGTLNTTTAYQLNGTDVNTTGTFTNVAYKAQNNSFTVAQTFAAGIGLSGGAPSTHGLMLPSAVPSVTTTNLYNDATVLTWLNPFAATTVNTGQGANELYDMNQNVQTTDSPAFDGLSVTGAALGLGGNAVAAPTLTINGTGDKQIIWRNAGTTVVNTYVAATTHAYTIDSATINLLTLTQAGALATASTITAPLFSGPLTGNATTATALQTARAIGGVNFDGTAAIVPTTIVVADTTDTTSYCGLWTDATGDLLPKTDAGCTYNASTGVLTATGFSGPLTGNVTGNASGTAATVTTAAQPAITSVGTLTILAVDNIEINGNTIASTAGTDLNITPLAGQQIVLDATIEIDAGVVTGATSITSTTFIGALTGNVTGDVSGTAATVTGATQAAITSAANLATVGTITSGTWSASFGAVSGANLTTLNASNISSGTIADARLEATINVVTSVVAPLVTAPSLTTSSGAMTITPAAGSNLNVSLSTTGDFAVNTDQFYVDTSTGRIGIGTASPAFPLDLYTSGSTTYTATGFNGAFGNVYIGRQNGAAQGSPETIITGNIIGAFQFRGYTATVFTTAGYLYLNADTVSGDTIVSSLVFGTANGAAPADRWKINGPGHFLGVTDNTYDIGAAGATRPRTGYFGTSVVTTGLTVGGDAVAAPTAIINGTGDKQLIYKDAGTTVINAYAAVTTATYTIDSATINLLTLTQAGALAVPSTIAWGGGSAITSSASVALLAGAAFTGATSVTGANFTLGGAAANIVLGSNFLSGDGGDEGVSVEADGDVVVSGTLAWGGGSAISSSTSLVSTSSANVFTDSGNIFTTALKVRGAEGGDATFNPWADEGDDAEDRWSVTAEAAGQILTVVNAGSTGSLTQFTKNDEFAIKAVSGDQALFSLTADAGEDADDGFTITKADGGAVSFNMSAGGFSLSTAGVLTVPDLSSVSGVNYLCSSTTGVITNQSGACVGTDADAIASIPALFSELAALKAEVASLRGILSAGGSR